MAVNQTVNWKSVRSLMAERVSAGSMGWWPFGWAKKDKADSTVHIKGTRAWLSELQEACERNHDSPAEAHIRIRHMQVEWTDAHREGDLDLELFEGLERRSFRLLMADGPDWLALLDNLDFWKPGWRPDSELKDSD